MELALAIFMAIGIFVGIPALIGVLLLGIYTRSDRRIRRAERSQSLENVSGSIINQTAAVKK